MTYALCLTLTEHTNKRGEKYFLHKRCYDIFMDLAAWSLTGLVSLVVLSHITSFVFNIRSDAFYSYFHLTAGVLAAFLFYSLTGSFALSIGLTLILGVIWEVYEWYEWRLIVKKKRFQPQPDDTRNDLVIDFVGALLGVAALVLLIVK